MTKASYKRSGSAKERYLVMIGDAVIGWVSRERPRADEWCCEFRSGGSSGLFGTRDDAVRRLIEEQLELQRRTNIPEDSEP